MIKLFEKKIKETGRVQSSEEIIISAKEALNISSEKYSVLPTKTVFETIQKRAHEGFRNACFDSAYINGKQLNQLRELGYTVDIFTLKGYIPYFKVSW